MSSGGGLIDGLIGDTVNGRRILTHAVLFQLGLMSVISLGTLLAFELLRPNNKRVYQPKSKYYVGDKRPPEIKSGLFSWIAPVVRTKEAQLLDQVGLDAVAFLRFLRMLRWMFASIALVSCAALIPINLVYNERHVKSTNGLDVLAAMTIANVRGNILYAHVAVYYVICFIAMFFVYVNWKAMVDLRKMWFRSPEHMDSFYARTLMITGVPKKLQSDEGLQSLLQSMSISYPVTSVHIGRRVDQLPELIEYHNNTVRQLEEVLVRYLHKGRLAKNRPYIKQGGFLGFGGRKFDAIDFYTEKLRRTEDAIEKWRETIDSRKAESYGFASMASVPYAHIVASQLRRKRKHGATVELAPNPKDLIWENLQASPSAIARKKFLGWLWLVLFCAFNTLPLLAISVLANLQSLTAYVGFLDKWATESPNSFALISGVLPPAVSGFFGLIFPWVLRRIGRFQGSITTSKLDRVLVARYFAFLVISQLIIFTLIGVLFNTIKTVVDQIGKHKSFQEIFDNFDKIPDQINTTYLSQSSYWLTWLPLRGFLFVFDLAQILNLAWVTVKTHLFGRTPRDIREWTQPPDFEYSTYYSNILFMTTICFVFAPLAPLVVALGAVVFLISAFVYKYQLMFVYTTKVETGGRLWNAVINRLLVSIGFMQLLMTLTIGLQHGFKTWAWISTIPPMIFLIIFKWYLARTFSKPFKYYVPTEEELSNARLYNDRSDVKGRKLEKRFGHPALHIELFTPLVHANTTHLLQQVYHGRLGSEETRVAEYGGAKVEAQVAPGGIKIAGVAQSELEYDPTLYQRDRGEADWDARSMASTTYLNDNGSAYNLKRPGTPALEGADYNEYMSRGPRLYQHPGQRSQTDFEMSRLPSRDDQPLLGMRAPFARSETSLSSSTLAPPYSSEYDLHSQSPTFQYPPPPAGRIDTRIALQPGQYIQSPPTSRASPQEGFREAPLQRYGSPVGYGPTMNPRTPSEARGEGGGFAGVGGRYR